MKEGGWFVDGAPDESDNCDGRCSYANCEGYGFSGHKKGKKTIGYVNATFKGSGTGKLEFGNCYFKSNSVTKVYLNDLLIASAPTSTWPIAIRFDYKRGDILKLTEERRGIIKLVSLRLESSEEMP